VLPIRKKLWPAMIGLLQGCIECRHSFWRTAGGENSKNRSGGVGCEEDRAVGSPGSAARDGDVTEGKGDPPEASMRFSLPLAKNPRERLSGDQNGRTQPVSAAMPR
jgi:hypothetical protein